MKKILSLALSLISISASAQYEKKWDHTYGSAFDYEYPEEVCSNSGGDLFSAVGFSSTHDIDPDPSNTVNVSPAASFQSNAYIKRMDNNGNYLDHVVQYCTEDLYVKDMECDAMGNIYITGYFSGDAVFDSSHVNGSYTASNNTIFVAKYDPNLDLVWVNYYGGIGNDQGSHLEISDNTIYVAGRFADDIDFDSSSAAGNHSTGSTSLNAGFVLSLGHNGNYMNSADFYRVTISDLEADNTGNFIFSGTGWDQVDLDYSLSGTVNYAPNNTNFAVICRYNFGFAYENHFIIDGGLSTQNYIIDTDLFSDGSIIAVGNSDGGQYLESGNAASDVSGNVRYMFKLDNQCTYDWSYDNYGNKLVVDNLNNIYSYGELSGSFDFDPSAVSDSVVSATLSDPYVVKLDSHGDFEWVKTVTSNASYAYLHEICLSTNNEVFAAGGTDGSGLTFQGGGGPEFALEFKLGPISTVGIAEHALEFIAYPNPTTDFIQISTNENIQSVYLYNSSGQLVFKGNDKVIDLSGFAKGLYTLQISTPTKNSSTRIVKN